MAQYKEGQTATGPKGDKIVYRAGKWQPLPSGNDDLQERIAMRASGMPVVAPIEDPTTRIADPKRRDITRGAMLTAGAKDLGKAQPAVDMARNNLAALAEFEELNESIRPSGGYLNRASNWVQDALGSEKLARMEQLSNSMARLMRQPGEGAVSDYEGKLFRSMVGGYNQPYATNVRYARAAKALAQRQIELQQFREAYLQANNTLVGSDTMWARYRDANPILDRKGNPRKVAGFRDWFSTRMKNAQQYGVDPKTKQIRSAPPSTRKGRGGGETVYDLNGNPL